jgi:hypothetical protein
MNIFNNIYDNELEKEDDWGWFIRLDLDATTTNKKTNYIYQNLQTIDENQEYYETANNTANNTATNNAITNKTSTKKNTYFIIKTKYDFFKNILIYGLFYNCIYLDYIYKCINPFSCHKQKMSN